MLVAVIGVVIAIVASIYASVKPYPMDYDANGELLVDGLKMANDTFKAVGWMGAFMVGWILERRFVRFTTDVGMQERFLRLTGGLLGYYVLSLVFNPLIKEALPGIAGIITTCFLQMIFVVFLFPLVMARFGKNPESDAVAKARPKHARPNDEFGSSARS